MSLLALCRVVVSSLLRNKVRSLLTSISIIIGIATVIAVTSIGAGASKMMENEILEMGKNLVLAIPDKIRKGQINWGQGTGVTMTVDDYLAIKRELTHCVENASPTINIGCQVVRGNKNWSVRVSGVSSHYPEIRNLSIASGGFFNEIEEMNVERVCVIGQTVRNKLFEVDEDCCGQLIKIGKMTFRVVGVLESKGVNGRGQDQDDTILAPYTAVRRFLVQSKFFSIDMMNISLRSMEDLDEAKREITALLRQRHHLPDDVDDDFELRDTTEIMQTVGAVTRIVSVMLSIIAAISLFVGGVGIMNIMLVTVTERIKEIGLRMAIGATPMSILTQFLLEAAALSGIGGFIGVFVGIGLAKGLCAWKAWPLYVDCGCVVVAFTVAVLIGVLFGFFPAYKASRMAPIESLRYE